jgi:predicted proteasome-type protease
LTIVAQIALDDMFPGMVGQNESVGAVGIQEFRSLDYFEKRAEHALVKTALGDDARSQRAKKLIDATIRKARRVLFA